MLRKIKSTINTFVVNSFSKYGFNLSKIRPSDVSNKDWELYQKIRNLTMTISINEKILSEGVIVRFRIF